MTTRRTSPVRLIVGYAAVAFASIYIVLKALWIAGVPVGLSEAALDSAGLLSANVVTGGMALVGAVVALGFTHGWGQRLPGWLVLFPTWVGIGLLAPIAVMMGALTGLTAVGLASLPAVDGELAAGWLHPLVYSCFTGLGVCLTIGFGYYVRERWTVLFDRTTDWRTRFAARPVLVPLAWLGAVLASGVAVLRLFWGLGGTYGLDAANAEERDMPWQLGHVVGALFAIAGVVGLLAMLYGRPRWLTLAFGWVGTGSIFANAMLTFGVGVVLSPQQGSWDLPEAQIAFNATGFADVLAGITLGFVALMTVVERTSNR